MLAIVDADTGKLADPPDFLVRGFVHEADAFDPAVAVIEKTPGPRRRRGHRRRRTSSSSCSPATSAAGRTGPSDAAR